jgi:hypothetical protein
MTVANSGASLSAATSVGPGTAITLTTVCQRHAQAVVVTGFQGSGNARINLEVSMDDANWFKVERGGALIVSGNGAYYMRSQEGTWPALYVRGNLVEIDAGVTAVSVSSIVASE